MYSVLLSRFNIVKARHRVVGKRMPMGAVRNRGPVGTGNGVVIVSKKFSGTCRSRAKVTKCALMCRSHKFRLMRRRPFASVRGTVRRKRSVGSDARVMRVDARHVVMGSASGKQRLIARVGSLGGLLVTCQAKLVGRGSVWASCPRSCCQVVGRDLLPCSYKWGGGTHVELASAKLLSCQAGVSLCGLIRHQVKRGRHQLRQFDFLGVRRNM